MARSYGDLDKLRDRNVAEIRESGMHDFTGFRRGTDVWYYGECLRILRERHPESRFVAELAVALERLSALADEEMARRGTT